MIGVDEIRQTVTREVASLDGVKVVLVVAFPAQGAPEHVLDLALRITAVEQWLIPLIDTHWPGSRPGG